MVDESDDVTTWRYHRMAVLAIMGSALMHVTVLAASMPEPVARQERWSELAIELTLERPTAPFEVPARPSADQAAQRLPSGAAELSAAALAPGPSEAASAPLPTPAEPSVTRMVPSAEAPPVLTTRDFGATATPTGAQASLETMLQGVDAPPTVSGQDFARTAPSALARSSMLQNRPQAPPPEQPVRQASPKRASQQNEADRSGGTRPGAVSPLTRTAASDSRNQAQQDYLIQVVHKLSQARFSPTGREERQGSLIIARLTIASNGHLIDSALVKPSGSPPLDRGVMDAIRKASPFAPLPPELAADSHTFVVPINYEQER
ncbi:energy transducer TonB family protein [Reyranella soli]|uniref:TonB C-terminal domain-containing protein n=1 Tax=Reyranella soli TaxID=1230389 RepID=A0A512NMS7_9HYPH|nr:energy transducer TonB [Reyranella soli]GEP60251.1 hypothetical protein RSO01_74170 [Reyranella soli]